jgi:hypothetical protein
VLLTPAQTQLNEIAAEPRTGKNRAPDAIFVPTPQDIVAKMLELADLKAKETLYARQRRRTIPDYRREEIWLQSCRL